MTSRFAAPTKEGQGSAAEIEEFLPMALRMILTSLVVTMSLPLPSYDHFEKIATEINHEIGAAFAAIENELASRTSHDESDQTSTIIASETTHPESTKLLESPLDMAFDVVMEDFVREASELSVEQAQAAVAVIPAEPFAHPLPPAPSASEALIVLPDHDLRPSAVAVVEISRSCSPEWTAIVENRCERTELLDDAASVRTFAVREVRSAEIGPWHNVVNSSEDRCLEETSEIEPLILLLVNAEQSVEVSEIDSITTDWSAVIEGEEICRIEIAQIDATSTDSIRTDQVVKVSGANVRDALRKTVEALAAWSEVVVQPY